MNIGKRIERLRGDISRREFAKIIGIVENTLRNYEQGLSLPNSDTVAEICRILRVEPAWLLLGIEPMKNLEGREETQKQALTTTICPHCMELYAKLVQAQEREIELLKENRMMEAKISALEYKLSLFADSAESKENTV
jgi:transcriptional regulator with XRE-family HTH domain